MNDDVDFVVGAPPVEGGAGSGGNAAGVGAALDDAAPDELHRLPGARPAAPVLGRWLAAVGVLAAVLVVFVANRSTGSVPTAAPTTSAAPAPVDHGPPVVLPERTGADLVRALYEPPLCPEADDGMSACHSVNRVGPGVLAALARYFPSAQIRTQATQTVRDTGTGGAGGLWSRSVTADLGVLHVSLTVRASGATPLGSGRFSLSGRHYVYCEHALGRYLVTVVLMHDDSGDMVFTGLSASQRAAALARDQRLTNV